MDKNSLSQYGWVVIIIIILGILIGLSLPYADFIFDNTNSLADSLSNTSNLIFTSDNFTLDDVAPQFTNYSIEEINSNDLVFGIGKTKSEYVVATFNENYTEVTITKNGDNSDGLMMDFSEENPSPMTIHKESIMSAIIQPLCVNLGDYAFYDCQGLLDISFSDNEHFLEFGDYTFFNCLSLTNIIVPESINAMGSHCFYNCESIIDFVVPEGVTKLARYIFTNCILLENITVHDDIASIDSYAFDNCKSLKSFDTPEKLSSVGSYVFRYCVSLKEFIFPETLTYVPLGIFYGCEGLEKVFLHENITKIKTVAFDGCCNMYVCDIPDSVTSIENYAFTNCKKLEVSTVPYGMTTLNRAIFLYCDKITNFTIPDSVTRIEESALHGTSITEIVIPEGVEYVGPNAFMSCLNLETITFSSTLKIIDAGAFCYCTSLKDITIPESVEAIGEQAFFTCGWLNSVTILSTDIQIAENAFEETKISTIYGYAGSTAEMFANNNGYTFITL